MKDRPQTRIVPFWERVTTYFLGSILTSGVILLLGSFANPLTSDATTVTVWIWLISAFVVSLLQAKMPYGCWCVGISLIIVGLLTALAVGCAFRLGLVQAKTFGELLVKASRDYYESQGRYPIRGELSANACDDILREWDRVRLPFIRYEAEDCEVVRVGSHMVVNVPGIGKTPGTVWITESGPGGGPFLQWDWQGGNWVYYRDSSPKKPSSSG